MRLAIIFVVKSYAQLFNRGLLQSSVINFSDQSKCLMLNSHASTSTSTRSTAHPKTSSDASEDFIGRVQKRGRKRVVESIRRRTRRRLWTRRCQRRGRGQHVRIEHADWVKKTELRSFNNPRLNN